MIQVKNLHKKFGKTKALDGIDLTVNKGSIYGLVGTNGAGKTTVIRHMAGILKQDDGEILFDGEPAFENPAVKQRIGLVPDELFFPKGYSIKDMTKIYNGTYDSFSMERLHELTQLFRLDEKAPLRSFSKGMKKQAAIALTLASMPEYLPDRLEAGTHNVPGIAGLLAGMEYVSEIGTESIARHEELLRQLMLEELSSLPGLELFAGEQGSQSGVVSFRIRGMSCEEAAEQLSARGICLRSGLHCAPYAHKSAGTLDTGTLRASFSPFVSDEMLRTACQTIRELLQTVA